MNIQSLTNPSPQIPKFNKVNTDQYQHRKSVLRKYLNIYINKKHITHMKPIMISINERLQSNLCISFKQFRTLIKYLKNDMTDHTPIQLIQFFSPLIYDTTTTDDHSYFETYYPQMYYDIFPKERPKGTLEEFFH